MQYIDIFNVISRYYPIGIEKSDQAYNLFEGSKLRLERVNFMISSADERLKWKQFVKNVESNFAEIQDSNFTFHPTDTCFSVEFLLTKQEFGALTRLQKIQCHLSFLGGYFSIYGRDSISINDGISSLKYDPIITVSPIMNYEKCFILVRNELEKLYSEFSFLPFELQKKRVFGLTANTLNLIESQYSSVFQALFTRENLTDYKINGDIHYR